jgi:hypothetical protein
MLLCISKARRPAVQQIIPSWLKAYSPLNQRFHSHAIRTKSSLSGARIRPCPLNMNPQGRSTNHSIKKLCIPGRNDTIRYSHMQTPLPHRAFIALGSNMGDRVSLIERACNHIDASPNIKILRTSSLYETKAMYVLDQDNFVNGACEVHRTTPSSPYTCR